MFELETPAFLYTAKSRNVRRLEFSRDLDLGLFQTEEERIAEERDKTKNLAIGINQSKTEFLAAKESLRRGLTEISVLSDVLEVSMVVPLFTPYRVK